MCAVGRHRLQGLGGHFFNPLVADGPPAKAAKTRSAADVLSNRMDTQLVPGVGKPFRMCYSK